MAARAKSQSVDEYMKNLDHPLKAEVQALREIMLGASGQVREEVKWNAPSFYIEEHFATFNLHAPDHILVIFHRGARAKDDTIHLQIDDPQGLLEWLAGDRCAARFRDMGDVQSAAAALQDIARQWIRQWEGDG